MNMIDRNITEDTIPSDPQMLVVFLHYALEDVRKHSERSATLLEAAIGTLAKDITAAGAPRSLS